MAVPHPGRFGEEIRRNRRQMRRSWYMSFFQLRGLSDFVVSFNNYAFIRKLWRDWSGLGFCPRRYWPGDRTLKRPGVKKAALGYYRSTRATGSSQFARSGLQGAGANTGATGSKTGALAQIFQLTTRGGFSAGVDLREIPGVGHFLHQEAPETINDC